MRRRDFLSLVGGAALIFVAVMQAQPAERMRRVGVLMGVAESDPEARPRVGAFERALQEHGWASGRNLIIDYRWPTVDAERMRAIAKELVDGQVEVVVATGTAWVDTLLRQTRAKPIVFVQVSDPVGSRFVASLAQPGGNATGFTTFAPSMGGKWVEVLREIAPRVTRVALMFNPKTAPGGGSYFRPSFEEAARAFAIQSVLATVESASDIEARLAELGLAPGGGVVVMTDQFTALHRELIVASAARHRVPAVYPYRYFAAGGGLMSYGVDTAEQYRSAAGYVDRILRGAKPGELPVQAPTKFELVINAKTAKSLGLPVSPALLTRADEIID